MKDFLDILLDFPFHFLLEIIYMIDYGVIHHSWLILRSVRIFDW